MKKLSDHLKQLEKPAHKPFLRPHSDYSLRVCLQLVDRHSPCNTLVWIHTPSALLWQLRDQGDACQLRDWPTCPGQERGCMCAAAKGICMDSQKGTVTSSPSPCQTLAFTPSHQANIPGKSCITN